ncbi:hypothetical protein BDC45DRAFT_207969 [Circinella umbellata]|nr:hypothetical protein BDC45DRAFT_207969 [Circinella umbellata]
MYVINAKHAQTVPNLIILCYCRIYYSVFVIVEVVRLSKIFLFNRYNFNVYVVYIMLINNLKKKG